MCTYVTEHVAVSGSGKGRDGWFQLTDASVYLDHPVHASTEHTLNIDFLNPQAGPSARVAVELTPDSARQLATAIALALRRGEDAGASLLVLPRPLPQPGR
jgi:Family of unknown function (DUF6295)